MIDAVIATEDHDFYNHPGVDVGGILRAAYTDVVKRSTVQGASTITEQLVKNVYAGSYSTDAERRAVLRAAGAFGPGEDPRGAARGEARAAARQGSDPRDTT